MEAIEFEEEAYNQYIMSNIPSKEAEDFLLSQEADMHLSTP